MDEPQHYDLITTLAYSRDIEVCGSMDVAICDKHTAAELFADPSPAPDFAVICNDVMLVYSRIMNGGFPSFLALSIPHPRAIRAFGIIGARSAERVLSNVLKYSQKDADGELTLNADEKCIVLFGREFCNSEEQIVGGLSSYIRRAVRLGTVPGQYMAPFHEDLAKSLTKAISEGNA